MTALTLTCACQKYSAAGWRVRCAACGRDTAAAVEPGTLPTGATSSTATGAASGRELGEATDRGGSIDEDEDEWCFIACPHVPTHRHRGLRPPAQNGA